MCHPDLTRGLCCICFGTLTDDNRHHNWSDLHKGKCALLAGQDMTDEQKAKADAIIAVMHAMVPNSWARKDQSRRYYEYIDSIATEDHYDMSGPE